LNRDTPVGRVEFARQLYNFLHMLEEEQENSEMKKAISSLKCKINHLNTSGIALEPLFKVWQVFLLIMRRADARVTETVSHFHRVSVVRPDQGTHREEDSRGIERA
jgi:hypothetical protein